MSRHSGRTQLARSVRRGRLRPGFTGVVRWEAGPRLSGPAGTVAGRPAAYLGRFRGGRLLEFALARPHGRQGPPPTRQQVVAGLYAAATGAGR